MYYLLRNLTTQRRQIQLPKCSSLIYAKILTDFFKYFYLFQDSPS